MRQLSLKARITLVTITIITIVIVVVSTVAYHELQESLVRVYDPSLRAVAGTVDEQIAAGVFQSSRDDLQLILNQTPHAEVVDLIVWSEDDHDVRAVDATLAQGAREWISQLRPAKRPNTRKIRMETLEREDHLYRAAWFRRQVGHDTLSFLAITPVNYAQHEMGEYLTMQLILGGCMLLAAGILAGLSVYWTMRPIRLAAARLDGITYRNLGAEYVADIDTPIEIAPFVNSVRAMLVRVAEGAEAQKRFIAEASHELRTPLALAKSTIQAVRLKVRTSEQYQITLDELLADVDRLGRLVGQLLDLARLEQWPPGAIEEEVPLGPTLRSLAQWFEMTGAALKGRIVCDLPDIALAVKGNEVELEGLFRNLIDNAIKHGPAGGEIALRATVDNGNCIVSVHDEGGNIPADQIPRLCDRFYRVDASRSRATGGSGLGLAIARQAALRHGGDLWITSTAAEGTTVFVRLPLINPA
ncbi:MAG: hypothetical protein IT448_07185 [Phycisphaerales bacterium]|nr:hypothetical protein [Phycisphaerales bacterium]